MSGYIENEIVEANRLRSQEALSGNNENPAQWTNTLSNIYELNAGDKVSMYSGFISERGAGSLKTIELVYDRIVPGGILMLDDYGTVLGETKAIEEFLEKRNLRPEFKKSVTTTSPHIL